MENRLIVRYHPPTMNRLGRWNAGPRGGGDATWKPRALFGGLAGIPSRRGNPNARGLTNQTRKAVRGVGWCPYRKPTQVGWGHSPQADERTLVKELGKLAP